MIFARCGHLAEPRLPVGCSTLSWTLTSSAGGLVGSNSFAGADMRFQLNAGHTASRCPDLGCARAVRVQALGSGGCGADPTRHGGERAADAGQRDGRVHALGHRWRESLLPVARGAGLCFDLTLIAPGGSTVFSQYTGGFFGPLDAGAFVLAATGDYTLLIAGDNSRSENSTYRFRDRLGRRRDQPAGARRDVSDEISQPGQIDSYTFTLSDETRVLFDSLSSSSLNWTLTTLTGQLIQGATFSNRDMPLSWPQVITCSKYMGPARHKAPMHCVVGLDTAPSIARDTLVDGELSPAARPTHTD